MLIPGKWAISFLRATDGTHGREEILEFRSLGERLLLEVRLVGISNVSMMSWVINWGEVHDLMLHRGLLRNAALNMIWSPIGRYCTRHLASFDPKGLKFSVLGVCSLLRFHHQEDIWVRVGRVILVCARLPALNVAATVLFSYHLCHCYKSRVLTIVALLLTEPCPTMKEPS